MPRRDWGCWGRSQHLQVKGRTEQRSGTVKSRGLNGAQRVRREMGGRGQREAEPGRAPHRWVFLCDSQAAESCVSEQGVATWSWSLGKVLPSLRLYVSLQARGPWTSLPGSRRSPVLTGPGGSGELCSRGWFRGGHKRAGEGRLWAAWQPQRCAGPACSRRPWEPSRAWSPRAWVWKGEGEGARSKASTALWVKAVRSTGLCQSGLRPLLALRLDDLTDLSVPRALLR